jgi:hypothetical protein
MAQVVARLVSGFKEILFGFVGCIAPGCGVSGKKITHWVVPGCRFLERHTKVVDSVENGVKFRVVARVNRFFALFFAQTQGSTCGLIERYYILSCRAFF